MISTPPSKHSNLQMTAKDVRHFQDCECEDLCKQAIKRIKDFYIFLYIFYIYSLLPTTDDIVTVCAALTSLQEPLSL